MTSNPLDDLRQINRQQREAQNTTEDTALREAVRTALLPPVSASSREEASQEGRTDGSKEGNEAFRPDVRKPSRTSGRKERQKEGRTAGLPEDPVPADAVRPQALGPDLRAQVRETVGEKRIYQGGVKATLDLAPDLSTRFKRYSIDHHNVTLRQLMTELLSSLPERRGVLSMAANRQESAQPTGTVFVSPFYHEAKNEITRPNHFVGCSRYLVEKWLPRLGPLGFSLVLYLRSLGYYNPVTGERRDSIQINQADLCAILGVSLDTLQREMKRNEPLGAFVRVQKSYQRRQAGHLQREDSIYYIAMDDPLVPEDVPLLEAILARKEAEAKEGPGRALIRPVASPQQPRRPQFAAYGTEDRKPQNAAYGTLRHKPQIAVNLLDIPGSLDIPKDNNIPADTASHRDAKTVVAFLLRPAFASTKPSPRPSAAMWPPFSHARQASWRSPSARPGTCRSAG